MGWAGLRLLLFTIALLLGLPAAASDEGPDGARDPDMFQAWDAAFGTWVVDPIETVIYWDVLFWDNQLPAGEGVGTVVGDEVITGHGPEGYAYQRQVTVPVKSLVPALEGTERLKIGEVELDVKRSTRRDPATDTTSTILMGKVVAAEVDLEALGLEPVPEGEAPSDAEAIVVVDGLAPFGVSVDRRTARIVPTDVLVPGDRLGLEVGDRVVMEGDAAGEIVALGPGGSATVLAAAVRHDTTRLPNPENAAMPIIVLWLVVGSVFFTLRMRLVNLWGFVHALVVTAGKYDDEEDEGEISHFQALSSALSATVGLGNIAGVAIAVTTGGPGAIFWMMMAGFLGMSSKFTEVTLGLMYRETRPDGSVSGGPMHYLDKGLPEVGVPQPVARAIAVVFALMCIGGSLGGGNMFQANQSYAAVAQVVPFFAERSWAYGLLLAFAVGLVIIGGIKRIGRTAGLVVPLMCVIYLGTGLFVVIARADQVPAALTAIVSEAFTPRAGLGGMLGVLATGFKRAAFSSEAGVGSASIAHSAATTNYPVREGIVALLEPFIDTIVVCATTGLVVVVTGMHELEGVEGVVVTQKAFGSVVSWFPQVLSFAVLMFAFSTMISWSYYGERCATWLFGEGMRLPYRVLFLAVAFFGSVISLGKAVAFSDAMILSMAFPNIFGAVLLSGKARAALDDYWAKLKGGEFGE